MREIHYAAARGDVATVLAELRAGADVNQQDPDPIAGFGDLDIAAMLNDAGIELSEEERRLHEAVTSIDHKQFGELEETPLIRAAGDWRTGEEMLACLLDHGADVNRMGGAAETCALGEAIRAGDLAKVRLLLARGADPNYVTRGDTSAWVDAAYCRAESRLAVVDLLAELGADNREQQTVHGEHPATVAARRADFELLSRLLEKGVRRDALQWTPLMWELVYGTAESVARELASTDLPVADSGGKTAMLLAATVGDVTKARQLVAAGAEVGEVDHVGRNALHFAAEVDRVEMIHWLVEQGLDVDGRTRFQETPLMIAAESGSAAALRALLELGADPTLESETDGRAIGNASNLECVRALVAVGEDLNFIGGDGYHLLKQAAEGNEMEFVRELLNAGVDANTTSTGDTALHTAIGQDHLEIAEMLLRAGADPSRQDVDGWSALHYCRSRKAVRMIVDAEVDLALTDDVGNSAGETFTQMGRPDLAEYLNEVLGH